MRADPDPAGGRGVWALGTGSSGIYGCGATNSFSGGLNLMDVGPNNAGSPAVSPASNYSGDNSLNCAQSPGTLTNPQLYSFGMGCRYNTFNSISDPRSQHPGGLLTVFCDGSVHWIDDTIQVGVMASSSANIVNGFWEMLFLSQDGGAVPADVYGGN